MTINQIHSRRRPSSKEAVWIAGMGCVSPAGIGVPSFWRAVKEQHSLIRRENNGFCLGRVPEHERRSALNTSNHYELFRKFESRFPGEAVRSPMLFTILALHEAMENAGWDGLNKDDGFILATTTGQIPIWERDLVKFLQGSMGAAELGKTFRHQTLGLTLGQLVAVMEFDGPATLVTSACAASTQAVVLAKKWIESGKVKRCLVGATELLCDLTIAGFDSFQLLSSGVCKPFDRDRQGINLSEGSGFLCLERGPGKVNPDEQIQVRGGGIAADAFHMTAPEPNGSGCVDAMSRALVDAQILADDVDWIHAHGTGSIHNDLAEGRAIGKLFGSEVPVTSTKGIHGHPLAASGVLETILCVKAMQEEVVLPTTHLENIDENIRLNLASEAASNRSRFVVKNTLGFGGTNGSLVLGRGL